MFFFQTIQINLFERYSLSKFIQYFKDAGKNTSFDLNEKIEIKAGHINILTAHSSKGLEFKKALFSIWLGNVPADANLKEGMLGKE